jgi:hypothetical protein
MHVFKQSCSVPLEIVVRPPLSMSHPGAHVEKTGGSLDSNGEEGEGGKKRGKIVQCEHAQVKVLSSA